jgi:hypothetical protein
MNSLLVAVAKQGLALLKHSTSWVGFSVVLASGQRLVFKERLAAGGFGTVYRCVCEGSDGADICVKIPHDLNDTSLATEARFARAVKGYRSAFQSVVGSSVVGSSE